MSFVKLKARIEKDLGLNLSDFERTYPGKHQRSQGAFVWTARDINNSKTYGSSESAKNLLKMKEPLGIVKELCTAHTQFEIS